MLVRFFFDLRTGGVPVSLPEFLTLLEALEQRVAWASAEEFYYLASDPFEINNDIAATVLSILAFDYPTLAFTHDRPALISSLEKTHLYARAQS